MVDPRSAPGFILIVMGGLIVVRGIAARGERDRVCESGGQDLLDSKADGLGATGKGNDDSTADHARGCPREDRVRTDLIPAQPAKGFAEAIERFLEKRRDHLDRAIAGSDASAAGDHDGIDGEILAAHGECVPQGLGFLAEDGMGGDRETSRAKQFYEQAAPLIVFGRA